MIKSLSITIDKMPCDCYDVFKQSNYEWTYAVRKSLVIIVSCIKCKKNFEIEKPGAWIVLETKTEEPKKFPITIKGAQEVYQKYLDSLPKEIEKILPDKKEYIH